MAETAAARYARDWSSIGDDRKTRTWDGKSEGRKEREYVSEAGDPAGDTGTVGPDN